MIGFVVHRCRTYFWTMFYHTLGRTAFSSLGKGSTFEGWIDIPQRGGRIRLGRNARICRFVEFSVPRNAELIIGEEVFIGRGVTLSAHKSIHIGDHALIAAFASIQDNNHVSRNPDLPINAQGFASEPMDIGADCWIGTRAVLVKGSGLGAHSVLGAGAVLTKKLPDRTIAVGVPAKPIERSSL